MSDSSLVHSCAEALDDWLRRRTWRTPGGERWTREVAGSLREQLGQLRVADFEPPAGTDLLRAWRTRCRREIPIGPKRMEDYVTVLGQLLRDLLEREQLRRLPRLPDPRLYTGEVIRPVVYRWINEETFRALRAEVLRAPQARAWLGGRDQVARRRLYLSFAFYTGMRRGDLNELVGASVSADLGLYLRKSTKTGRAPRWCKMPPPLLADVRAELERRGRPWRPGDLICGGRWKNVARVLDDGRRRLGISDRVNLRVLRRSFARQKVLAHVDERDLIDLLGHVDSRMVRQVYVETPRELLDAAGEAWPDPPAPPPRKGPHRSGSSNVIELRRKKAA